MTDRIKLPTKARGSKQIPVQVNDVLIHPMAEGARDTQRSRWKYRYLRVTRQPTLDRPDSGRILVENEQSGDRKEFYAMLFGVTFKDA